MDLHRALLRGEGFFDWMTAMCSGDNSQVKQSTKLRKLPVVDFLATKSAALADAIVAEIPAENRAQFRRYLTKRPLGLGMISDVSNLTPSIEFQILTCLQGGWPRYDDFHIGCDGRHVRQPRTNFVLRASFIYAR